MGLSYIAFLCQEWRPLTHWGRVPHICVGKLTIIGLDNSLSPGRRQAIIWTNDGILLIGHLGTNFSEILIGIQTFSIKKMHLKMSSAKRRPFCLGLNVLNPISQLQSVSQSVKQWVNQSISQSIQHWAMTSMLSIFFLPKFFFNDTRTTYLSLVKKMLWPLTTRAWLEISI